MKPSSRIGARRVGRRSATRLGMAEDAAQAADQAAAMAAPGPGVTFWVKLPAWVLLVGSVWVVLSLFTNARFRVTEVTIEGARLVQQADVLRATGIVGQSIFDIRARQIERRLEESSGLIEAATVRCRLPNQVAITLLEREAALIWESGGRYWWIAADDTVLGPTDGPGTMPVLHDIAGFQPEPAEHIPGVPWGLAHELWAALPAIQAFDYTRDQGLVLYVTSNEWPVYLGHQGDARIKVSLLWTLVEELATLGADVEYIDLRNEERPIYKIR
jgi:hypothetical protein